MNNPVDLNAMVSMASADLHNTLMQTQDAIKALQTAAEGINTQVAKVGALLDALTADAGAAKILIQDADGKIKEIKLPWLLK